MSFSYQLFNQDFISSELYYLPLNSGINKIITCNDLLGKFQWSDINSLMVSEIQSSGPNILINGYNDIYQHGQITISLNTSITIDNITLNNSITANKLYGNLKFMNNINLMLNNIDYVNNITARQYIGEFLNLNKSISNDAVNNNIVGSIICDSDGLSYNFINNENYFIVDNKPVYSTAVINTLKCHINFYNHSNDPRLSGGFILNQSYCDIHGCDNVQSNNFMSRIVGYEVLSPRFYTTSNNRTMDYLYGINIENNPIFYAGDFFINYMIGLYIGNCSASNIYNKYGFYIDANQNYINGLRIGNNNLNLDNNNINNINYSYCNRIYVDNIYEKTASNNIIFNNHINLNSNNILNCNNLNSINLYGEIKTSSQPSILTINNLIRAGNLDKLNTNNIIPYNSSVSLGSSSQPFHSLFLSSTIFTQTARNTYAYIDNIFENTSNNKIIFNNDIKLYGTNIVPYINNTSSIGVNGNNISSIYSNNTYTNNIYEADINNSIYLRNDLKTISNIYPNTDNTNSLGTSSNKFNALHLYNGYIDKIYEANTANNITFMNNTNFNNNNINGINTLTASNINGSILTNTQNNITVMNNLINAGNLRTLNTANITPYLNSTVNIGTSILTFLNAYFSGTIFSESIRINALFENSLNNGIFMNNNVILNNVNILPNINDTCNIGSSSKIINSEYLTNLYINNIYGNNSGDINLNNIIKPYSNNSLSLGTNTKIFNLSYVTNMYTSLIGSLDLLPITIINDTNFNNNYITDLKGIKFYNETEYLNSYVESSFSLSYSLSWSGNITVYYVKIGKNITLIFPSDSISRVVSNNYLKLSTIPSGLRPLNSILGTLYGSDNSSGKLLSYVIQNDGIIYVGNSSTDIFASFTSGTLIAGFYGFSISYRC